MEDLTIVEEGDVLVVEVHDSDPRVIEVVYGTPGPPGQGVPVGGTTGQMLAKNSNADYDTEWVDPAVGGGGTDDQTAAEVPFTPTGTIASTNVQAAIVEVNNEKQPLSTVLTNTTASFTTALETKLNGIEAAADVTDAANVDAAGAVMNADVSTAAMAFVVDEDAMTSNSATKVPTQQSVKAYVDGKVVQASSVPIVDAAGLYTATNVEDALAEVKDIADTAAGGGTTLEAVQDNLGGSFLVAGAGLNKTYDDVGNSLTLDVDVTASGVPITDAGNYYTGSTVEAALQEIGAGGIGGGGGGADDQTAAEVPFTPTGGIAATNVQNAIAELDAEKQPLSAALTGTTASFTTADETKLDGIEAGATADQTAAEVPIADADGFYASGDVEGALTEVQAHIVAAEAGALADAAVLDQAHEDSNFPHAYHPRIFLGNGSAVYSPAQNINIYVSFTPDEADPDLTGQPAGTIVITPPASA